ncbi:hypothetical protein ABZ297_34370 [Nonomuraea sp. NPDC005983]|uniref:hypothetical protein n=1 Tax=Nonomuraea sp. NPDC005983 TaxID=3155595 RepID=UPI0033B789FC
MVRALGLTRHGRRYLEEMRFRPLAVHREGLVLGDSGLAGTLLPQPQVLIAPNLRTVLLDEVLGDGFALLAVDVPATDWARVSGVAPVRRLDVVLGERLPRPAGDRQAVADADGRLETALSPARGRFVLVKPDRYIAAVFPAKDVEPVAALLRAYVRTAPAD